MATRPAPRPRGRGGRRQASALRAVCGLADRASCDRGLAVLLHGVRSDQTALRRAARTHCAIFQCAEERGISSCGHCPESPCIFHDHLGRICPAGEAASHTHTWRLPSPGRGEARARRESRYPQRPVPERAISRLRWYLAAVEQFRESRITVVSSAEIGARVGVGPALVRRDLCYFGQFGTPSRGYQVEELWGNLLSVFETMSDRRVVWVGADRLASDTTAIAQFAQRNWQIVAVADHDPERAGAVVAGLPVCALDMLETMVQQRGVNAAVLAISEAEAQGVAERLVASGVDAILNLAPVALAAPEHVVVQQADLATQLMLLSYYSAAAERQRLAGGSRPVRQAQDRPSGPPRATPSGAEGRP